VPSKANKAAFEAAVQEIAMSSDRLLKNLDSKNTQEQNRPEMLLR
jgi:hypothetical protein